MNLRRLEVFLEFLIFGVIVGVIEDLIAIQFATEARITWSVFLIVFLVAIPFAFLGEVLIDRVDFIAILRKIFKIKNNQKISASKNNGVL